MTIACTGEGTHCRSAPTPDVTLAKARERLAAARRLGADGVNPSRERKREKRAERGDTFKALIEEWQARQAPAWAPKTIARAKRHFELLPTSSCGGTGGSLPRNTTAHTRDTLVARVPR